MTLSDHCKLRLIERKITLTMVADTIRTPDRKYKQHVDSPVIAFDKGAMRVVVDPLTLTIVTAMWTDGR